MSILIGPDIFKQTPEDYYSYVKSLRQLKPSNASKGVPDVTITKGKTTRISIKRASKQLTEAEVTLLASEYAYAVEELTSILTARKVKVVNSEGVVTNAKPHKPRSGRPRKASKANARSLEAGTEDNSSD